jgi:hypothetical protein
MPANVQNVAQPSKKAQQLIIGLLMVNSIVYPVEIPSTVSSSQPQPMKPFIWAPAILLLASYQCILII